ncbi:MAG: tRNA preQ1(34) S-adenosylmethionine ribosyltransferase-isomerase QueA [Spirochaetaceae bacterium]|jgi:S-adenosylmethionine:tRNA ribosyltransferase-isomerase|nr:tRNA preQ1(34) S-adenosylmethionine ribosyltransferase-isomerase QueA [Spirochaetaceae bacterium]
MTLGDFYFDLPRECIARYPSPERGKSRLMVLDRLSLRRKHRMVEELPDLLASGLCGPRPLLVFNNSRVRRARLSGTSLATGAVADFLLLNPLDRHTWKVMIPRARRRKPGSRYRFEGGLEGEIVDGPADRGGEFRFLRFDFPVDDAWLDLHGRMPLPAYIKRRAEAVDAERYQTVYADRTAGAALGPGASAAAPTAGLHFTGELLGALDQAGVEQAFVTLHVGLGTFLPVRTWNIEDHVMHEEAYSISAGAARQINDAGASGRKILAVGTTSARTLESAWAKEGEAGKVRAGEGRSSIFIYPGYRFKAVDALLTNFHTPGSTLLMLVSAFAGQEHSQPLAGRDLIMETYTEAIRKGYRFFSYGDAMLIT